MTLTYLLNVCINYKLSPTYFNVCHFSVRILYVFYREKYNTYNTYGRNMILFSGLFRVFAFLRFYGPCCLIRITKWMNEWYSSAATAIFTGLPRNILLYGPVGNHIQATHSDHTTQWQTATLTTWLDSKKPAVILLWLQHTRQNDYKQGHDESDDLADCQVNRSWEVYLQLTDTVIKTRRSAGQRPSVSCCSVCSISLPCKSVTQRKPY